MDLIKRLTAAVLAAGVMLTGTPMPSADVFAAQVQDEEHSGTCGENLTWEFDESTGTLTISGTGEMTDWSLISFNSEEKFTDEAPPWYEQREKIIRCEIIPGVTTIGAGAFANCTAMQEVVIPESVTRIKACAFWGCTSLISVIIPGNVATIEARAFQQCSNLQQITIVNGVSAIDNFCFYYCSSLTSINIPDSVTKLGNGTQLFIGCSSLTAINVSENNENYESEGGVLFTKKKEELISYPPGKTETAYTVPAEVRSFDLYAFQDNHYLKEFQIPSTGSVFSVENGLLFNKEKDTLLLVPSGKTDFGTLPTETNAIGDNAFSGCIYFESITLPDHITSIGFAAFNACINLKQIIISSSVISIKSSAFNLCSQLNDMTFLNPECEIQGTAIPETTVIHGYKGSTAEAYAEKNNRTFEALTEALDSGTCGENLTWEFDESTGTLTVSGSGPMPGYANVSSIPWHDYYDQIMHIEIREGVTSISASIFANCVRVSVIEIPESVTHLDFDAFTGCKELFAVIIRGKACECIGTVPDRVTVCAYSETPAFAYAETVNSLRADLGQAETGSCTNTVKWLFAPDMGMLFVYGSGAVPDYDSSSNAPFITTAPWFSHIEEIQNAKFGVGITSIGNYALAYASKMQTVRIPDTVTLLGGGPVFSAAKH